MRHWVPRAAYALVALAVAGPMLAKGLVLAVDLAPVPHPHLATDYWGIPSGTHSGTITNHAVRVGAIAGLRAA